MILWLKYRFYSENKRIIIHVIVFKRSSMATIRDVAKSAGVSCATVSRYLNGSAVVSGEAAKKIADAVRKLNYSPNSFGRSLRTTKSKTILVLLPSLENSFLSRVIRGIQTVGDKSKYSIIIGITGGAVETERKYIDMLRGRNVDGAILISPSSDEETLIKINAQYPIIQCTEFKTPDVPHVSVNNEKAAFDMVGSLIENGHRKIGYIGFGKQAESALQREKGYRRALFEHDVPFDENLVFYTSLGFSGGKKAAERLIRQNPDAVFAAADILAIGAVRYFTDHGVKIPQQIAVAGFDGIQRSREIVPPLTTVMQPAYEMGCIACDYLIRKINGREITNETVMKHRLVFRESTGD